MPSFRSVCAAVASAWLLAGCGVMMGRSLSQTANDISLTTQVKSRIAATEGVSTLRTIQVHTHDDWVTLSGTVPDEAARRRIAREVGGLAGDNRIINQLRIETPPASSAATQPPR
jgi:osmotically-inducible protein OsmY